MSNSSITQKRAGGEKRGNVYDRRRNVVRIAQRYGTGAPVNVVVALRKRSTADERRNGAPTWKVADTVEFLRPDVFCQHCNDQVNIGLERIDGTLHLTARDAASNYDMQLDRIDPDGGYTLDNLQPLCGPCNKLKGNHFVG